MRIHRLSLTAFGPYPGTETIDFEPLNQAGLFLLTGSTGAGKSTVFEAICFALYGQTSLSDNTKGLKSHFAPEASKPSVEMEFTVGTYRYLVHRIPYWKRPSKRAKAGFVSEEAQVSLSRRSAVEPEGEWEVVATRNDEAAEHLIEVIGLNRAQFAQVVMLPQGRFAQFLAASSTEREGLLTKLFPTEFYGHVRDVLKEEAQAARARVEETRAELAREESALEELARRWDFPVPEGETLAERFGDAAARVQQLAVAAATRRAKAREAMRSVGEAARELETLAARWSAHRALVARREEVEADAEARGLRREALERAERAAPVTALMERLDQANRDHGEAERQERALAEQARTALANEPWIEEPDAASRSLEEAFWAETTNGDTADGGGNGADAQATPGGPQGDRVSSDRGPDGRGGEGPDAGQYATMVRTRIEALRDALRRQKDLTEAARAVEALVTTVDERRQAARQAEERADAVATRRAEILTREAGLREAAEALPAARQELERTQAVVEVSERLQRTLAERVSTAERSTAAQERRQQAIDAYERVQAARFEHAVGVLVRDLEPGSPCPVCGSTEHPGAPREPAAGGEARESTDAEVGPDALKEARARRESAVADAEEWMRRLSETDVRIEAMEEHGALADAASAVEARDWARAAVREAEQARDARQALADQAERLETEEKTARDEHVRLNLEAETEGARLQDARDRHEELAESTRGLPPAEALAARHEAASDLAALVERRADAVENLRRFSARVRERAQEVDTALADSLFTGTEDAAAAALPAPDLASLRDRVGRDAESVTRLDEAWNAEDHVDLMRRIEAGATEPTDEERSQATERVQRAESDYEQCVAEHERLQEAVRGVEEAARRVEERAAGAEDDVAYARAVADLADVAAGNGADNALRMSLTTFILAAQLEEIAIAATVRLQAMTGGRYSLRHSDATASRGRHSGLGLEVYDSWSSVSRPTSTLSGGESFMASLCLALGLADVVQARAGGVEIDTLFVDEGFGSLDDATLEDVMDAIDGLRENGRVIGLVSHVADMKSRIPEHVRVVRSPTGSRIESGRA